MSNQRTIITIEVTEDDNFSNYHIELPKSLSESLNNSQIKSLADSLVKINADYPNSSLVSISIDSNALWFVQLTPLLEYVQSQLNLWAMYSFRLKDYLPLQLLALRDLEDLYDPILDCKIPNLAT